MARELTEEEKTELLRLVTEAVHRNVLTIEDRNLILEVCSNAIRQKMRQIMIEVNRAIQAGKK